MTPGHYDRDPQALVWARAKIETEIRECRSKADAATRIAADPGCPFTYGQHQRRKATMWTTRADWLRDTFLGDGVPRAGGGRPHRMAVFDVRLPIAAGHR